MQINKHYAAISAFYGDKKAERSGVLLINHINEGLYLLDMVGSTIRAKEAFCIHPLLQDDSALQMAVRKNSIFLAHMPDPDVVVLAMEYRNVANAYLSHHCVSEQDEITLGCIAEVNDMLIADKVQNRKDFEIHHLGKHENSARLEVYFKNWLRKLEVSEVRYQELVLRLGSAQIQSQRLFNTTG
jgi:hypothetical protein